jgi:hypothetical protein
MTDMIFGYILVGLVIILLSILFLGASCGGRENCGKKWCFIGIVEDYKSIIFYLVLISIILDIILIGFHVIER